MGAVMATRVNQHLKTAVNRLVPCDSREIANEICCKLDVLTEPRTPPSVFFSEGAPFVSSVLSQSRGPRVLQWRVWDPHATSARCSRVLRRRACAFRVRESQAKSIPSSLGCGGSSMPSALRFLLSPAPVDAGEAAPQRRGVRLTARAQRQRTSLPFALRPAQPGHARAAALSARTRCACSDARHEFSSAARCAVWRALPAAGVHRSCAQSCEAKTAEADLRARSHPLTAIWHVLRNTQAAALWQERLKCARTATVHVACVRFAISASAARAQAHAQAELCMRRRTS